MWATIVSMSCPLQYCAHTMSCYGFKCMGHVSHICSGDRVVFLLSVVPCTDKRLIQLICSASLSLNWNWVCLCFRLHLWTGNDLVVFVLELKCNLSLSSPVGVWPRTVLKLMNSGNQPFWIPCWFVFVFYLHWIGLRLLVELDSSSSLSSSIEL